MKTVYLILYVWHMAHVNNGAAGGPQLVIQPMPSLAACEAIGAAAKGLADGHIAHWRNARPAEYRCVEVTR